jgi:hypothetical protein
MARLAIAGAALAAAVALVAPANAAAPNYILVTGPGLEQPVVLDDWNENLGLVAAIGRGARAKRPVLRGLARRPRYDLAEFWGWNALPPPTDTRKASQHGWFYPAHGRRPALFKVMVAGRIFPRLASRAALAILVRHGVPTRR